MQPNLPTPGSYPPPAPDSANYLDSIAVPDRPKTISPFLLWGLIGGGLLIVGLFVMILLSAGGPSRTEQFTGYLYRLQALRSLSDDSAEEIRSSQLRGYNTMMDSILAGAEQEASAFYATYDLKELKKDSEASPVASEFAQLATTLDDARLNAVFDRTYAREVAFQLGQVRADLQTLYDDAKNEELRAYLEKTDTNVRPLIKQFDSFTDSQG